MVPPRPQNASAEGAYELFDPQRRYQRHVVAEDPYVHAHPRLLRFQTVTSVGTDIRLEAKSTVTLEACS
jgi:hypothetical protein